MVAKLAHPGGETRVAGHDRARVPIRAEQLGGVEAESARDAPGPSAHAHVCGAERLRGVLDHEQVVRARDLHQAVHLHKPAVQIDRQDGLGPGRDRRLDEVDIHVVVGADVDQHRGRADLVDHRHGRHEGVRDRDHLVAGPDANGLQEKSHAIGAVAHSDRVGGADERSQVALEVKHLVAHDEVAFRKHVPHRLHDLGFDALKLFARFPESNRHVRSSLR